MAASKSSSNSPFNWRDNHEPTVFAKDPYFCSKSDGKTVSQRATEALETKRVNGDRSSDLFGLSKPSKEREEKLLAYRNFGVYSRATPSFKEPK